MSLKSRSTLQSVEELTVWAKLQGELYAKFRKSRMRGARAFTAQKSPIISFLYKIITQIL